MRPTGTSRWQLGLVVCIFLLTHAAVAQVELGGLALQNLNGVLGFGYEGQTGIAQQSSHSLGVNGNLNTNGYFYNPGFVSFQGNTFYARADSNAAAATSSDSEGYNLGAAVFGGTTFPGYVTFGQNRGQSSNYGLPGLTGLNSISNNRDFTVSWMFKNLPLKNLSVFFADNKNNNDLPGVGFNNTSSTKGFGVATGGYNWAGFNLSAGYQYSVTDVASTLDGPEGGTFTSKGASNVFHVMTSRTLPSHSNFTLSAYRIMANSSGEGDTSNSDSNEFDSEITSHVWRIPLNVSVSYNDNVYGSTLQQLDNSGQVVDLAFKGPKIGELNTSLFSSYTLPQRIFVTGFVSHQEEFIAGQSAGATAFGGNVSYGFGKFLKGLTLTIGMHDAASQVGNTGAGLVAAANYSRYLGTWHLMANGSYNQGVQTVLAMTTESSAGGSVSLRRSFADKISFGINAGYGRSIFSTADSEATKTQNGGVNVSWMKQTLSAYYSESSGSGIATSTGVQTVTVPGLVTNQVSPYSGKSYNLGYANTLIKNMNLNFSWSRFVSTGGGAGLFSNVSAETYTGGMTYTLRKVNLIANFAHSTQGASVTTALPSDITVFYCGISRWFNFF